MLIESLDVKPAAADEKVDLIGKCQRILLDRPSIQITEFEQLNELMVKLMGGVYDSSVYGTNTHSTWQNEWLNSNNTVPLENSIDDLSVTTPWLVDHEEERAIQLTKSLNPLAPHVSIFVAPSWEALPLEERDAIFNIQDHPIMFEHMGIQYTHGLAGTESPHVAVVKRSFAAPRRELKSLSSYISGVQFEPVPKFNTIEEAYYRSMPAVISNRVLNLFLNS